MRSFACFMLVLLLSTANTALFAESEKTIEYKVHTFSDNPFAIHISGIDGSGRYKETGAKYVRNRILWQQVEPIKGIYTHKFYDEVKLQVQSEDAISVPRLEPINTWGMNRKLLEANKAAQKKGTPWTEGKHLNIPSDMASYCAFVQAVVERYDGDGIDDMPGLTTPIKIWEVINEYDPRWSGTTEDLLYFFREFRKAVKRADPEAETMHGGFAELSTYALRDGYLEKGYWHNAKTIITREDLLEKRENAQPYLRQWTLVEPAIKHGKELFDYMNFHHYGSWDDIPGVIAWLQDEMDKYGYQMPIVSTEMGGPFWPRRSAYTPEKGAEDLVKYHLVSLACGVVQIHWSSMIALDCWGEAFANTALIQWKGTERKPAYYTYCLMVKKLKDMKSIQRLKLEDWDTLTRIYEITMQDNTKKWVAWSELIEGRMIDFAPPWQGRSMITDISGKVYPGRLWGKEKKFRLNLTDAPIFIEPASTQPNT